MASAGVLLEPGAKSGTFSADDDRPRALALIGYHNADYIRVALNRLFRELNRQGTTVQVTHSEANAAYGNRILRLQDGWLAR